MADHCFGGDRNDVAIASSYVSGSNKVGPLTLTAGTPEEMGTFVNGKKEGKWVWYDKYGQEGVVAQFKDGKMTSMQDNTAKKSR